MKLFGVTVFGIRFPSILFGSLSIILIYFLGKEIFNKKTGLIAAILTTISSYQISFMEANMDTTMTFFTLFSLYFFTLFIKTNSRNFFYLAWLVMGIAVMVKPIALLFLIGLGIASLYYGIKKSNFKVIKNHLNVGILLLIMFSPVLIFNYLLFKDKGILDLQFSRFTRISVETYQSIGSTIESFSFHTLFVDYGAGNSGIIEAFSFMGIYETFAVILFAVAGLFFTFKNKNNHKLLLVSTFLFPFLFLAGTSLLPNHFLFTSHYITLFSAFGIYKITNLIKKRKSRKIFFYFLIILFLFLSYLVIVENNNNIIPGKQNELGNMINFKNKKINEASIVVVDGRIYSGRTAFMFWDKNYLYAQTFIQIIVNQNNMGGEIIPINTYFIECISDDCGWGSIDEQPEFNQSMEQLSELFKERSDETNKINDAEGNPAFNVYRMDVNLPIESLKEIKKDHNWFFYPVNYKPKSQIFDNYQTYNLLDKMLDDFAHIILYLEILISFILIIYIGTISFKNK